MDLSSAKFTKKEEKILPAGSKIIKNSVSVSVEEIENGFIISKNSDIEYQKKGDSYTSYMYVTKKYFSETNPLKIDTKDKNLASIFD